MALRSIDLMIGDWVLCDGKPYQIAEIGGMVCLDAEEELFASMEDIDPIPLTQEILSKNDWVDDGIYTTLFYTTNITIEFYFQEGILRIYYNNEMVYQSLPGINYVHTLQHHLRLCEIEKEIEV